MSHRCDSAPSLGPRPHEAFGYKADLDDPTSYLFFKPSSSCPTITGVKQRRSSHSPPTLRRMHLMTPPSMRRLSTSLGWIASGSLLSIQPGSIMRPSPILCMRVRLL